MYKGCTNSPLYSVIHLKADISFLSHYRITWGAVPDFRSNNDEFSESDAETFSSFAPRTLRHFKLDLESYLRLGWISKRINVAVVLYRPGNSNFTYAAVIYYFQRRLNIRRNIKLVNDNLSPEADTPETANKKLTEILVKVKSFGDGVRKLSRFLIALMNWWSCKLKYDILNFC